MATKHYNNATNYIWSHLQISPEKKNKQLSPRWRPGNIVSGDMKQNTDYWFIYKAVFYKEGSILIKFWLLFDFEFNVFKVKKKYIFHLKNIYFT